MSIKNLFFYVIFAFFLMSCLSDDPPKSTPTAATTTTADVIVYGPTVCSTCDNLKAELTQENIDYLNKNTDDSAAMNEMMSKVEGTSWYSSGVSIQYPVVDVKGNILENPSLAEVQSYL